jgi:hypothetical protein
MLTSTDFYCVGTLMRRDVELPPPTRAPNSRPILGKILAVPRQFQPEKNLRDFEFGQLFLSNRRAYH